jgi:histidine ammonia-lyase
MLRLVEVGRTSEDRPLFLALISSEENLDQIDHYREISWRLAHPAGMFSGLMLSQYTADMQIVEQKILSAPAYIQSIPAAADQEDFVSMGMNSALKTRQILDLAYGVLGIEFIAAAQALDLRSYTPGRGTQAAKAAVRKHVDYLEVDRPLYKDHNAMKDAVRELAVLDAVETAIGELATY